jgi:hypothetical protein
VNISTRTKWLTGIAAAIAGYVILGPKDPESSAPARAATPVAHTAHATGANSPAAGAPLARSLLALTQRVAGEGAAGALFATHSWYVPPPPPPTPAVAANAAPVVPPKPVAPPLPFTYMGSLKPDGSATPVFFLTHGDKVYDVHVGDTIDDIYTVDSFTNGQLIFTYKPLNQQQQLITGGAP